MEYTGEKLKAMADDLRERMIGLQRFNALDEINVYCDNLEADVTVAFDSAFRHLQRLQESMLGEINEYRSALIETQQQKAPFLDQTNGFTKKIAELDALKAVIPQLCEQSRSYMAQGLKTELRTVREQEAQVRKEAMGSRFMRFKPNRFFDVVLDHVGSFEYLEEIPPVGGRVEIHDDQYCVAVENCDRIMQISFMPDDRLVVASLRNGIFIYRASDLSFQERFSNLAASFSVLPTEKLVLGGMDGKLAIYDLSKPPRDDGERDFVKLDSNKSQVRGKILFQVLLPNGNLATSDTQGRIEVWDLSLAGTDKALVFSVNEHLPCRLGALSSGFLVSCTVSKSATCDLKLWDLKSSRPLNVIVIPLSFVFNLLVLPNDQVVCADSRGCIVNYDPIGMQQIWKINFETVGAVAGLAYLSNGCLIAGDNNNFKVLDPNTGKLVQTLDTGISNKVTAIHISHDGKRMAFAAFCHDIKISKLEIVPYD